MVNGGQCFQVRRGAGAFRETGAYVTAAKPPRCTLHIAVERPHPYLKE